MKKVLITGASGFIGRHCLDLVLNEGYEVHAVYSKNNLENSSDVLWHKADLLDPCSSRDLLKEIRPSHLLHFAWYAVPGKYWTSLENADWVQASLELLKGFAANGGERAVMAGTCAEYDWRYGFCSEAVTPLNPSTLYGTCKQSLQLMLDSLSREMDISSSWGRIFFLYGPNEHPQRFVSSVILSLLTGGIANCSHCNQIRDMLYVKDVASAFVSLLESDIRGPVNIGSGIPVFLKDVVQMISDKIGVRDRVCFGSIPVSKDDPPLIVADSRRLQKEVGWRPRYDLSRGLDEAITWWRQSLEGN